MLFSPNFIYHKSSYQGGGRWLFYSRRLVWLQEELGASIFHGLRKLRNVFQPQKLMWTSCLSGHIRCAVVIMAGPVPGTMWHCVGNKHFPKPLLLPYRNVLLVPASRSWKLTKGHECQPTFTSFPPCHFMAKEDLMQKSNVLRDHSGGRKHSVIQTWLSLLFPAQLEASHF